MSRRRVKEKRYQNDAISCLIWLAFLVVLNACDQAAAEAPPTQTPTSTPTVVATAILTPTPSPSPESACPIPDLLLSEHIAASGSYTQTETSAVGPIVCRIEHDSCPYHLLVGNLDPTIIFKNEEAPPYQEDFLMHPAMLLPLYRLNQLVRAEWGGAVQLRITDAYDSTLEHDLGQADNSRRTSLHFEGRSVDLTTWPTDTNRYARLCALAHCAGFDWVFNEGDHCHASIKADSLCTKCSN
ncbi:MAG: hypothetical protein HYR94_01700 [Chloroflexi bacterium]|nr:hypothetical protein [Chloroflexota bacterium]